MQTANDPLDPSNLLGTIEKLKHSIEDFAEREKVLGEALTARWVAAKREANSSEEASLIRQQREKSEIEDRNAGELKKAESDHAGRIARIDDCYHSSRNSLTSGIKSDRDRKVGALQADILQTKKERRQEWADAKEELITLKLTLDDDRARLADIQKMALKAMRGFKPMCVGPLAGRREVNDRTDDAESLRAEAVEQLDEAEAGVTELLALPMPKLFRFLPLTLILIVAVGVPVYLHGGDFADVSGWILPAGIAVGAALLTYFFVWFSSLGALRRCVEAMQYARGLHAAATTNGAAKVERLRSAIRKEATEHSGDLSETLRNSDLDSQQLIQAGHAKLERQLKRLPEIAKRLHNRRIARVEREGLARAETFESTVLVEQQARESEQLQKVRAAEADHEMALSNLAQGWPNKVTEVQEQLLGLSQLATQRFPRWSEELLQSWKPPSESATVIPFGELLLSIETLAESLPQDPRFSLAEPSSFELPLALSFPDHGSLLLEGDATQAAEAINEMVLRLLATHPPGQVAFTFIDPVGLGRDYAGLMHLGDYEDSLIHGRIWTQSSQIEDRLAELNEHLEKVIQMYLRNEYETITEYNAQEGSIAEKYQFVVIAGFPSAFSELAMARLRSLAASGARCGVYLLIQVEPGTTMSDPTLEQELRKNCLCLRQQDKLWVLESAPEGANQVSLVKPPSSTLETKLVHRFGKASIDSNRVEVPFSQIAPRGELWTEETGDELRVPIGRTGARKLQYLAIGKGTRQHALIAGKTGSGKSTLFHVMITNLALFCSPEEVEFYLVDFKKGVEFKCYGSKRLPHARVVAIESDREFGLSVLHRVDDELRRRGELFRKHGSQDLAGYRKTSGHKLPRTLLLIDEFQEFFTEDDGVAQEASLLLDRIVRQGRAFGVHAILGSQTLGGAYTLARATLGQMVIRIALQCNEADAYLIMEDDNPAPRLLTRPGEGIYNDNAGALASNSPFQTVWLSEDERNAELDRVVELAKQQEVRMPSPVVFEGNAPADLRDNELLAHALATVSDERPERARAWLGAPNSIKGPTEAVFRRQSGSNLLLVGQGEERINAMMGTAMISLSAHYSKSGARFILLDPAGEDAYLAALASSLPQHHELHIPGDLDEVMTGLAKRLELGGTEDVYLLVRDLHRFKPLKQDDEFHFSMDNDDSPTSPAKIFLDLINDGPAAGIHVIAAVDTWNNLGRLIPRKVLGEFQQRVLFQMSANDSASLIDSPVAGNLGLHRAVLYNEAMGSLETFRPYSLVAVSAGTSG